MRTGTAAADLPSSGSGLAQYLESHREELLTEWLDRISATDTLRPRSAITGDVRREVLRDFYDAILQQISDPGDLAPLEAHVETRSIHAFTPDTACRLTLELKYSLQHLLSVTHSGRPEHEPLHLQAGRSGRAMCRRNPRAYRRPLPPEQV